MPRLWRYLIPHRWTGLSAILAMAFVAATETAIPALLKPLLDNGFGAGSKEMLWLVPAALVGLAIVRGAAQFGSTYLMNRISNDVLLRLRMQIFDRMLHASAGFYQRENTATLINGVVFEVSQVLQVLTNVLITLVRDSLTVVGLLGYLLYLNWKLTLIVMVIIPVIGFLMTRINRRLRTLNRDHQARTNALSYVVEEAAGGYKVVKIHGGEAYELERFEVMARQLRNYSMRMAVASGLNQPMTQLLASIALSIVLVIAIMQSASNQTTVGGFVAFVGAMMLIISPLKHLADISQPLQRGLTAAEMIFRMIDEPAEEEVLKGAANTPLERARGELRFEEVSFSYPPASAGGATRLALDRVSLHVREGEVVALVGPSGSGKTTFANLVPRFFSPGEGRILLDGMPLDTLVLKDLRRQIALVSQDVILFNDTLAANIAYGATDTGAIDLQRVERAVDAAFLRDVVDSLPAGLQANIGDNGSKLSGGQRQRVAIARAIYKDAPILILDEATSALDSESERQVQAALERLMQGRTTLVIAHRLSTIEKADRIVVLEKGRIVEQGPHRELLAREGLYAGLHRLQYSGADGAAQGMADRPADES